MKSSRFLGCFWSDPFHTKIMRTCIKAYMSLNFGQIPPLTTELAALERLKNRCHHVISVDIDLIFFKLAGNKDMHNIMNEFEFRPDRTTDYGVSCSWASKKCPYRPYNGENGVSTFSLLFLIGSFWYFHVTRTSIKACMSWIFWNEIWPWHIWHRWAIVALWATCSFWCNQFELFAGEACKGKYQSHKGSGMRQLLLTQTVHRKKDWPFHHHLVHSVSSV